LRHTPALLTALLLAPLAALDAADPPQNETAEPLSIRGVNYYPRETPWGGMWTKTSNEVWAGDMKVAAALGVNTIRTFVMFGPYMEPAGLMNPDGSLTPAYHAKIESLLAAAAANRIRVMFCFEFDVKQLAATNAAARWQRTLSDLVTAHRDDARVLMWDLMNEPDDPVKWNDATRAYLKAALPFVRQLDTNHLITIGFSWRNNWLRENGWPDVLQYHEYVPKTDLFAKGVSRALQTITNQRKNADGRPLLIGEFGLCTARDPSSGVDESLRAKLNESPGTEAEQARLYELILDAAEQAKVAGAMPWCLYDYPIKNPNESHFGLVRADGSLKPAALVLRNVYSRWAHP
jgi:endo-1,4-beta-mannosidase